MQGVELSLPKSGCTPSLNQKTKKLVEIQRKTQKIRRIEGLRRRDHTETIKGCIWINRNKHQEGTKGRQGHLHQGNPTGKNHGEIWKIIAEVREEEKTVRQQKTYENQIGEQDQRNTQTNQLFGPKLYAIEQRH